MTATKCLYIHGSGGTPEYNAVDDRTLMAMLLGGGPFDTVASLAGSGIRARSHGTLASDALEVTTTGNNDNTVSVAPGMGIVRGTRPNQDGSYLCRNDAAKTLTLNGRDPDNETVLYAIVNVRDSQYTGANDDFVIEVSGSPTGLTSRMGLARFNIPPGSNPYTVDPAWITDIRPHARSTGGITPVNNLTEANLLESENYDFIWDISTSIMRMYLNGEWLFVGSDVDSNWATFAPDWGGSVNVGTTGSPEEYGRIFVSGRTITGIFGFTLGNDFSLSGDLFLDLVASGLPPAEQPGSFGRYMAGGRMYDFSLNRFWSCAGDIHPVTQRIEKFSTVGTNVFGANQSPAPVAFAADDQFRGFFNYESVA